MIGAELALVRSAVGVVVEGGNVIGRTGQTERVIKTVLGFLQAETVPIVEVLETNDGWRLDVGVRSIRGSDVVMKAMANEFGTRRIPERSFFRATVDRNRDRYADMLQEAIDYGMEGDDLEHRFKRIGAIVVGDIQRYMTELRHPPNAPSTIRRKGSANPLIDTGQLRQSIEFRVLRPDDPEEPEDASAPTRER